MKTNIKNTLGKASFIFTLSSFLFISCDQQEVESFDSQKDTPITILSAGVAEHAASAAVIRGEMLMPFRFTGHCFPVLSYLGALFLR